jgi:nicotinamide riboside transporter PnuC
MILNQDKNEKNITDFFKKKENIYLLEVFGLSGLLLGITSFFFTAGDSTISYFLSLISSILIINGYSQVKKGNKQ